MEQRITIITLGVKDLKESAGFYRNKFGWKSLDSSSDDIYFFGLNGLQLALYPIDKLSEDATVKLDSVGFHPNTLAYNVRSEKEVDDTVSQLEKKGVKVIKKPQKVFWGGYSGYVSDPDGNLWEIAFNPYLPLDENGSVKGI